MKTKTKETLIEKADIASIYPYPKNAKKHTKKQIQQIAASIQEFGFNQPIVVDKAGVIIVGHGRFEASKLLGLTEVPIVRANLTEEQAKTYRLSDNKLNESAWVMDLALDELKELPRELFKLSGFNLDLITESDDKDDAVPENVPTRAKLGEIYQLGKHRVMCGDSTKFEDVEKLMSGVKSNMIFTDPPWNVAIGLDSNPRHRQRKGLINDNLGKDFRPFLERTAETIANFNTGDVYCVMGCEEWPTIHKALTDAGLHWSSTVIWAKDIFVLGRSKYHRRYEPIWYGWKSKSTYVGGRDQDDLWQIARPKRSPEHPTMKPIELMLKAIKNSSQRGDIVLDLFGGSGATLIAAEKAERTAYLMELDPKYVDVIVARWEEYTKQEAVKVIPSEQERGVVK